MPRLFPQLLAEIGQRSAVQLATMSVAEAGRRAEERALDPSLFSVFSATGGTPVTPQQLEGLRNAVLAKVREHGFPGGNRRDTPKSDADVAVILRNRMDMTASEAAAAGVWEYLTCILMPDIVIWRWRNAAGGGISLDRFVAGRRNNFHRLWWRAYVLAGHMSTPDALQQLAFLTEDDTVATLERPNLFGNLRVMRTYYDEFRTAVEKEKLNGPREDVNRDAHKRLLRVAAVRALESLSDDNLRAEVREFIRNADIAVGQKSGPRQV